MIIEARKRVPDMPFALISAGQRMVDEFGLTAAQALDSIL